MARHVEDHMRIARRTLLSVGLAAGIFATAPIRAQAAPPAGRRIAINGYDPVAYFTDAQPQKGSEAFWFAFDDAVYLFRSADNRAKFMADPERYAPQYAGFCAGGVSKGYKVEPDPEAWAIINGKLFLFQFKERVPAFRHDTAFIDKASSNWPGLKDAPIR
jgi:hypothetical protein